MAEAEISYVYCHECKELLFKGRLKIALGYSTSIESYPILGHFKHPHIVGNLWYINYTHPEIDTSKWQEENGS